jgi:hypothetical protein
MSTERILGGSLCQVYELESVKAIKWRSQIEKKGTVSIGIHIRRGDYVLVLEEDS